MMQKVLIVGLGLIGASYAEGLTKKGYEVYGVDLDDSVMKRALEKGFIKGFGKKYISQVDIIILALYPKDNVNFIKDNVDLLRKNQILTDVAGTKSEMMDQLEHVLPREVSYCSHHPMAGKEKRGIDYADSSIFHEANFIIVPSIYTTTFSIEVLTKMADDLGFKKISNIDRHTHDQLIAYTSQLPHAMAVALMNAHDYDKTASFIGDSFRDLTRIAMINEVLWSELFFENKASLMSEIDKFEKALDEIKHALNNNDKEKLKALFKTSTDRRRSF